MGPDHPDVATALNNLAALYSRLERYDEAEPLLRRSLAIREKVLGPDHLEFAHAFFNLAALYRKQKRFSDAEPLHKRSLAIPEKGSRPQPPRRRHRAP